MMRHKKTEIERYRKKHDCKLEYEQRENDFSKMWKTADKYWFRVNNMKERNDLTETKMEKIIEWSTKH